jgi:energy-coupling factor transporter ATP-binding protein EcfA2
MRGRVGALIALGAGFNPVLTGRENIFVAGSVLGFDKAHIHSKLDSIIDFAEISSFIDSPVQTYSSGMQVRLGFAVASAFDPDILILDEVLAVGDRQFSHKCFNRLGEIRDNGAATLLVSHSEHQLSRFCDNGIFISNGNIAFTGGIAEALARYSKAFPDQHKIIKDSSITISNILKVPAYLPKISFNIKISFATQSLTDLQARELAIGSVYWLEIVLRQVDSTVIGYCSSGLSRIEISTNDSVVEINCSLSIPAVNCQSLTPSFALWNKQRTCCIASEQGLPSTIEQDNHSISIVPVTDLVFAKNV